MTTTISFETSVAFLFGIIAGSFLNVVAYRVPRGESIAGPRSHCPACACELSAIDLIPVASWLWLRGRCRRCGAVISVRYPVLELLTGVLWAVTVWWAPTWPLRVAWAVFWLLLVAVVGTDLTAMRVPNVLSLPGAAAAIVLASASGLHSVVQTLLGAGIGAGVLFVIHLLSRGNMGMGDVKLYLSIGAMLGPLASVESLVVASLSGAVIGLSLRAAGLMKRREHMPFVPHIAIGVVLIVFFGQSLTHWYVHRLLLGGA